MSNRLRLCLLFLTLTIALLGLPAFADNVTITGNVLFSSLDGSSLDHDHIVNGVFTVNDGDLTVLGTINCNDNSSGAGSSACPMQFVVSGNLTLAAGSGVYAENRASDGNGANISFTVGGNVLIQGTSGAIAGAIVSSSKLNGGNNSHAGDLTINAGGTVTQEGGSVLAATASDSFAGAISITSGGASSIGGQILSGPTRTIATSTIYTNVIMSGGGGHYVGGPITIKALTSSEPGLVITSSAIIASQGSETLPNTGNPVTLEACGVQINGLVASVARDGSGEAVIVRGGTTITINSSDLAGSGGTFRGCIRASATQKNAAALYVNFFAKDAITVTGPPATSSLFSVMSNPGTTTKWNAGTINVISTGGVITATGNAFQAAGDVNGDRGGTVNLSAKNNITLGGATIDASGSTGDANRAGGHINVRSYSGAVSWTAGVGDVRPVGSTAGVPTAQQGTISLTYCTTLTTTGTSFPTNGSPVGVFPTTAQTCSPAAPTLPAGNTLPTCNTPPVANNDNYTVAEGGTLNVSAPGVLANDTDAEANPLTAILVTGPAHAASFTLNADGSFNYVHDGSETTSDSFTYKANDGSVDSNVATVNITITPVNDAPVANNDNYSVAEGGTLNVTGPGVMSNDTDPDGPSMTAILVSGPSHASSFTLNPNGSFNYVHDGSETTSDSFTYKVSDGSAFSNVATVSITVSPVNDAPTAVNDSYSVAEGGTLTINAPGVLGNDTDPDSPTLTAVLVSGPSHASSFTLNANGSFNYVHDGSETTSDSFTYNVSDGSLFSNVATVSITISPVNDAPVANDDAYSVAEGGTLNVAAQGTLTNDTDVDSPSLTAVLVSGPAHAASFTLNADGSFIYVHDGSETTSDAFTYKANDGSLDSNVATVTITVSPVNDAPVLTAGGTLGYTENQSATAIDTTTTINDSDSTTLTGATVQITGNYVNGEDVLSFTTANGISGVFTAGTGTLALSGTASVANYQTALQNVKYANTSDNPSTSARTVTWQVDDGAGANNLSNTATSTINVTAVNDAPVLTATGSLSYTENQAASAIDTTITVSDLDNTNIASATVQITGNYVNGQDVLGFTTQNGIAGIFTAATGTLALSGSATLANYQTALRSVTYANTSDNPSTATRTVSWTVNDGTSNSNTPASTITVTSVNDAPVLANPSNVTYTENDPPLAIDTLITVSDADSANMSNAAVQFGNNYFIGEDVLNFTDTPTITGNFNPSTGILSLTGVDTVANYQTALRNVRYLNTSENPTAVSKQIVFYIQDDAFASASAIISILNVVAVNDAPVMTAGGSLTYTEGDVPSVIDNGVTVSDVDSANITGATVQITGNYLSTQDVLSFSTIGAISGSFNSATGTMTLSGTATVALYQAALRTVKYNNTSTSPSIATRTVTWIVTDGTTPSTGVTSTIDVISVNTAPTITGGSSIAYTENQAATVINNAITVTDSDTANMAFATVQISTNYVNGEDVLSFATIGSISGTFNATNGTLTLSGSDTVANYQAALRTVKYTNTSDDPSTATRTVTFQVNDGEAVNNLSNTVNSTISVTAVNDPPVAFAYSGLPAQAGIPITYPAGKLGGTDAEAGTTVTIDTTPINLVNIAALTINANGSFTMTPTPGSAGGTASFQYRVSDNGNPPPGVNGAYVTVSFAVAGPAIYFVKSPAVGLGNCTLGNECLIATALSNIGSSTNANIFIEDANTHTAAGTILLNSGGSIIGQGVAAASFDSFFGLFTPAQGTLAPRPAVNQPRPTVASDVTLNNNSQARGFNLNTTAGDSLVASAKTGLVVSEMNVTTSAGAGATAVRFTSSSGTFTFDNITATGAAAGVNFNATTSASTVTFGNVSTSSGAAVTIASSGATNFTFTDVTSTTGTTVSVATATGAFTFRSITSGTAVGGPVRAIVLNNLTGGSFSVTGDGSTANSGGIIQRTSGAPGALIVAGTGAIDITSTTSALSFKFMRILAPSGNGMMITNSPAVISMEKSSIDHNNAVIANAFAVRMENHAGSATLTLDGVTINNKLDGSTAVSISAQDSANITFNAQDSNTGDGFEMKFTNLFGSGMVVGAGDNAGANGTVNVNVSNAKFVAPALNGINNLEMTTSASSVLNFNVSNNTFDLPNMANAFVGAINVNAIQNGRIGSPGNPGTIDSNTIANINGASGGNGYNGIRIAPDNAVVTPQNHRILIQNNTLTNIRLQGIVLSTRGGSTMNAKVLNNTIGTLANPVGKSNRRAIETETQAHGTMFLQLANNPSIVNSGTSNSNSAVAIRSGTDNVEGTANGTIFATITNNVIKNSASAGTGGWFKAETGLDTANLCLDYQANVLRNNTDTPDATKEFNLNHISAGTFTRRSIGNTGTETITSGTIGSNTGCTQPVF